MLIVLGSILFAGALDADAQTVKALMTMGGALEQTPPEELPLVVVEIQDPRHIGMLRSLYQGSMEIITGDEVISRLAVQTVRHPGLSDVFAVDSRRVYVPVYCHVYPHGGRPLLHEVTLAAVPMDHLLSGTGNHSTRAGYDPRNRRPVPNRQSRSPGFAA